MHKISVSFTEYELKALLKNLAAALGEAGKQDGRYQIPATTESDFVEIYCLASAFSELAHAFTEIEKR